MAAIALLVAAGAFVSACGDDESTGGDPATTPPSAGRIRVVATTTQIADMARVVAGSNADVTSLVQPNQDPHELELTPDSIRAIRDGRLILRHGLKLDRFADKPVESVDKNKVITVTVTDGIKLIKDDPHVWFSVDNARRMTMNIRDALRRADSANAATYQSNADGYLKDLDRLQSFVRSETDRVPPPCRKIITDHEVLTYYAATYSFQIIDTVIPGSATAKEPSARDITRVVESIRASRVPAIFAQASANPEMMQRVAKEANVKVVTDLYTDSLGAPGSDGDTYVKMMESNTRKIVSALESCPR